MSGEYEVVASREIFNGRVISVRADDVRMSDGSIGTREIVTHPGAVAIVALDDDQNVVLVRQYRHPVASYLEELPAGLLDVAGEHALVAAQRELAEETALTADHWDVLIDMLTTPGMSDEAVRVFLARGLHAVPDEDRFTAEHEEITMTVHREPLDSVVRRVLSGEIRNGICVAGVLAAALVLSTGAPMRAPESPWPDRPLHS
jgi:8-oxo-dGTP pyrophosphatase MutT (NUDIX family)